MPEYEDDHFDGNESTHSLDSEFGGFDLPIGVKKTLTLANEKLYHSTYNTGYDNYMAYHYAFIMKVATVHELEKISEAAKDLRWIEAMNEEIHWLASFDSIVSVSFSPLNACQEGFQYHHAEPSHVMMTYWLPDMPSTLPPNASHQIGIGAFVMNDRREVGTGYKNTGSL